MVGGGFFLKVAARTLIKTHTLLGGLPINCCQSSWVVLLVLYYPSSGWLAGCVSAPGVKYLPMDSLLLFFTYKGDHAQPNASSEGGVGVRSKGKEEEAYYISFSFNRLLYKYYYYYYYSSSFSPFPFSQVGGGWLGGYMVHAPLTLVC